MAKVTTCPIKTARAIMGSDAALRHAAPSLGAYSMWKHAHAVPWPSVGPQLLKFWRQASSGRGLIAKDRVERLLRVIGWDLARLERMARDLEAVRRLPTLRLVGGGGGYMMKRGRKPRRRPTKRARTTR